MPKYKVNGKTYNIPDEKVEGFEAKYPDATVEYHNEGKTYQIPLSKREGFLKKFPKASFEVEEAQKADKGEQGDKGERGDNGLKGQEGGNVDGSNAQTGTPQVEAVSTGTASTVVDDDTLGNHAQAETSQTGDAPLTEQDKRRFDAGLRRMQAQGRQTMEQFGESLDAMREYREKNPLGGTTAEGAMQVDSESGKLEKTYLTPLGTRHKDKGLADLESFRYRQAADMSVSGQLRKANGRLRDIETRLDERGRELLEEQEANKPGGVAGFMQELSRTVSGDRMGGVTAEDPESTKLFQEDKEYQSLRLAKRKLEEQIEQLENYSEKEGKGERFWHDFGRNTWQAVYDLDAWDFGKNALRDATTSIQLAGKAERGEELSEAESDALYEMYMHNNVMQEFGDLGKGARWGDIAGGSLSFMKDFLITGGGFNSMSTQLSTKLPTKLATKAATKLGIEASESLGMRLAKDGLFATIRQGGKGAASKLLAEQGLWGTTKLMTTRAMGVMAEDLLIRAPLMVGTVQGQGTVADIINTKLGPVGVDEETGELRFADDASWGEAVWETGADKVIENFSEMWGAHLPGMSDVTRAFGARALTAALLRSTRPGAGSVLSKTSEFLGKVGVNGYFGEVGEEYYGQLWRTVLDLNSSRDASGKNLLLNDEFHGDIWGGMALSIGLTSGGAMAVNYAGEGVRKGVNAAQYMYWKHQLNKSDAKASEVLTPEVWEGMRMLIDHADNSDMVSLATQVMNDTDMTDEQRNAAMSYMERSMIMRGYNLGEYVRRRNGDVPSTEEDELDQCYLDGYNMQSSQEMHDAKNMYEYQRQRLSSFFTDDFITSVDEFPNWHLSGIANRENREIFNDAERTALLDYLNAKQVYDGMLQRVRDDIDGRIDQSNAMVDARTNSMTGLIQPATMKQDDRKVYVVGGNLVQYEDGSGIDNNASDGSIIIRDAETGTLEQVSPESILNIDTPLNPYDEKETAAEAIRQQYAQEAANKIDGVPTFNGGELYHVMLSTGEGEQGDKGLQGQENQEDPNGDNAGQTAVLVQVTANEQGIIDNGDGTVNVTDGVNVFPVSKEHIQQMSEKASLARLEEFEQARVAENAARQQAIEEASRPQYEKNDEIVVRDTDGSVVHGAIEDVDEDGVLVAVANPGTGFWNTRRYRAGELDATVESISRDGVELWKRSSKVSAPTENTEMPENYAQNSGEIMQDGNNGEKGDNGDGTQEAGKGQKVEETGEADGLNETDGQQHQELSALERVPKDEQGNPLYEQADADTAWDAIVEESEGDEAIASEVVADVVAEAEKEHKAAEKALKKVMEAKPETKGAAPSMAERIAAKKQAKANIDAAQSTLEQAKTKLDKWKAIAGTTNRRKMEADAERRRIASEEAARLKAEEERLRAEREEAERIEREALGGVPDMVDDTPQDARARGYRRVSGHKIDRQEPVQGLQGKEIAVKFSDNTIPTGRVAVIEAEQLQPSHIGGQRNPLHFIDEAQPKERNDEASVLSARKIAGNIRPEEITSSVTAYTGAPTVNARGEAIQGNSRSDALRQMWESHPEQSAKYKQYLTDHAQEFGLNAEDIAGMQHPVLVNMLDVEDADAITLGQYVAQDTESGGTERIKPKNALQRMGTDIRTFANLLLKSSDEETSFAGLVDNNGVDVLKWMSQRGFITPTQYKSAFDSKGNLTAEAKNDLRGIMYQSIFKGGSTRLEEMFNAMPAKAQKAILATAFRDYDSPSAERMIEEIQNSIRAYYALLQNADFVNAKTFKDARLAVEGWKIQYQIDDVTGDSYLPAENFSNFALLLATMYKGDNQSIIQGTFNKLYDLIQGTQEPSLFEQPDNTPRTLVQAIKETLNITYNGQRRSNVLVGDSSASQRGQQGSTGNAATGERVEDGERTADSGGSIESDSRQSEIGNTPSLLDVVRTLYSKGKEVASKLFSMKFFDVAQTPKFMQELGLRGDKFTIKYGVIARHLGKDSSHTLTERDWEQLPQALQNPFAISKLTDKDNSYRIYTTLQTENGEFVVVGADVKNAGREIEVNAISTVFGRRNNANLPKNEEVIYRSKEITLEQSSLLERPNFAQYPTEQELSDSKDTTNPPTTNELGEKNAEKGENAEKEEQDVSVQEKVEAAEAEVNTNPTDKRENLAKFNVGDVVRDYYDHKLYRIKKHATNGMSTIAELDAEGNEVGTTTMNAHNNSRYSLAEAPTLSQKSDQVSDQDNDAPYTIESAQYTTKKGKVLDMFLVKFKQEPAKGIKSVANGYAKELKGWWDREKGGFMMRSEEDAKQLAEYVADAQSQEPVSMGDLQAVNDGEVLFTEPVQPKEQKQEDKHQPVWQYSVFVDKETGRTTLSRDDVSGVYPIGDARFRHTAESPEEMLDILRNPLNGMQEILDAVGVTLENKVKTRRMNAQVDNDGANEAQKGKKGQKGENAENDQKGGKAKKEYKAGDRLNWRNHGQVTVRGVIREGQKLNMDGTTGDITQVLIDHNGNTITVNPDELSDVNPSGNRLVSDERYAELRERMRKKLGGQMNIGIDPEILAIGTEMAVYHLEKGARKFAEYAKAMVADLGDAIRPYLKAFYNGARNLPEVESSEIASDMTPYDEVQHFDVANFDKPGIDALATAETVTRETEVAQEVEVAQERIKKTRSTRKQSEKKDVTLQRGLFDEVEEADKGEQGDKGLKGQESEKANKGDKDGANGLNGAHGAESGITNNETNNEDGLQRNDAARSEGVSANGNRNTAGGSRTANSEEVRQGSERTQRSGESGSREVSGSVQQRNERPDGRLQRITEPKNRRNNHSERGKDHAPISVDARIEANIKAIELAKQLLESGEQATEKQMQTLRKFSGWGGLGKAFSEGTAYAPNRTQKQLRELLGEEAYGQAVMSANSAYYTPAYVVDTLWDIAEQMGFKGGNILEGSAGIGNILGQMPTHISEQSDIHAIEIDGTSGGILSLLYPDAKVEIQGFEQTRIANGSVDLAITNVPFVTGLRVKDTTGDKDLSKKFHNIHDFCIAKNVRKLREGGLGIFITSNGTLDNSKKLRDWIVSEGGADFVGAFRMHNKTFGGTGVTSDIIVIRKRVNGKKSAHAIDVSTVSGERMAEYDTGETRKVKGKETPVIKQLSMDYNRYFIEHPENMAGEMHFAFEKGDTYRPTSKGLYPKQDKKQEQMLAEWVKGFEAEETIKGEKGDNGNDDDVIDAIPGKKIGEVFVSDGKLYINAIGAAQPLDVNANKVKGHTKVECFEAYAAIKEALAEVLEYQTNNEDDKGLKPLLAKLNKAYDDFVKTYGHFNKNTAIAFLRNDVDYANVFALEKFEEIGDAQGNKVQKFGKTDVFSKRVVEKEKEPTPTNVKDGIIASIFKFGRIDLEWIAEKVGKGLNGNKGFSVDEVKREIIESGYGFEDPATRQLEVSYLYLSGNVREKLRQAEANNENGEYDRNIKALQDVMPMDIPAHLIDFTLGSSWIEPKLYEDYVKERTDVGVQFTAVGGTWFMNEPYFTDYQKNRAMGVTSEMLGRTVMGHTLIEAAIQNRSITVSTTKKNWDGTTETITDKEATQACAAKIDEIRQDFKEWARQQMQGDPEMSQRMERIYNDTFNNYVPMSIPDDFVPEYFGGASHKFKMRPHQAKAIVRGTMQPLLLAHEVGTGKTFTLISTAMEMRRLGTARKPMIVVQNATVGQFVASAKELYPNAKILTLEEADRSAEGRKNFYAKIRYNDWDMIVVPQSTFEFIPDSEERQMTFVQDKIEEKMLVLEKMKEADPNGNSMITRQAEREIAQLEEQLAGLSDEASKKRTAADEKKRAVAMQNAEVKAMEMLDRRTDDVENFDDMGIDALLVDEAHEYKHLGFATAMQRGVKGVDPSYSKKSQGVYLKTQAVLEKNNGRNVIFATGTPISNTAAEIWTFMRYLMPADTMEEYGIYYFDDFVRNFGNIQQMLEFTTSGKFKENNRFAGYVNLPELVRIWSGVSDTVLTKEAGGVSDKIPEMEGGKAQDLYLPQTRALRGIMKFVKAQLERYDKMSGKEKKENSHIPLTMYGIAKAAAVDARLVQSDAEDDVNSKTNEAVRQTVRALKETADYKGTVAIFADNYQNKDTGFNLYEDIRAKLIAEGVSADEIVVMKSGMTVKKKLEIFEKVNRGEVRVILGSTFTLGTGVNIQERLHTLIHLDAPNRPMDYTQRNGRILRQGNLHKAMGKPVRILRFGVEDSLDVTAYQRLKTKGAIADSIMNGKQMMANSMTNRVLEEEEDVFGDTVAQLSGSEYAMLKNNAEKNVRKYASRKKQWEADQTYIHNAKPRIKGLIKDAEQRIEYYGNYLSAVRTAFPDGKFAEIVIGKHRFTSVEAMEDLASPNHLTLGHLRELNGTRSIDDFIKEHNKSILAEVKQIKDGEIAGEQTRELPIKIGDFTFKVKTVLHKEMNSNGGTLFAEVHRKMTYSCPELGREDVPVHQSLLRNAIEDIVNNVITGKDFTERLEVAERSKKHNEAEMEQLLSREGKPFDYENELAQAREQYEEYSELMKKELEEKEAKYAEMDATVEAVENLDTQIEEDDVLYREASEGEFAALADDFSARYNTVPIHVLHDADEAKELLTELKVNEELSETILSQLESGEMMGGYSPGLKRIIIFAPAIENAEELWGTLKHESIHAALDEVFPFLDADAELSHLADELKEKMLVPAFRAELEAVYRNDERILSEEVIAYLLENEKATNRLILKRVDERAKESYIKLLDYVGKEIEQTGIDGQVHVWGQVDSRRRERSEEIASGEAEKRRQDAGTARAAYSREGGVADDYSTREGEGAYTDDELSFENDPVAKMLGKSGRTRKQRKEFAERERKRMAEQVEALAKKLHLDNVEVITDVEGQKGQEGQKGGSVLSEHQRRAKGFYSKRTGKITIVIPNHTSVADVEQTLLHEAVAHYGLRQLFGEHFDTFLDNVFNNADEDIRRRIVDIRKSLYRKYVENAIKGVTSVFEQAEIIANLPKTENDFTHTATEEYLASLAEETDFENVNASWWGKIKSLFMAMLHKIGFEKFGKGRVSLTDNELRYILWRSYENLAEPGRYRSILGEAADVAKQYELKVGNYANGLNGSSRVAEGEQGQESEKGEKGQKEGKEESDDVYYREGDPEVHERELARYRYEVRVKSGTFQSREALQDSMLGLKEAMEAILGKGKHIEDVDGFENAYLGENRLSSVNKAEADAFARLLFKPMLDEVAKLARTKAEREELTDYMMAKHGLERNEYMRQQAEANGEERDRDFAGLTALTGIEYVFDAEAKAEQMVAEYEKEHDAEEIKALWERVNDVSNAILQKLYECGMMSKETFDKVSGMYEYYIPLRGFDEKTSAEAYAYLSHKQSAFNAPIKKAEGRSSKADDPFANLQSMAEGAIMQGNRNKLVKQRFLNFVLNHPSDLVSVSEIWVEYDDVTDKWKPVFPDNIDSTDTPDEVEQKMQEFEEKMHGLAQQYPDRYKHGKDAIDIPYRIVESRDMRQHQIVVKRGGRDYILTINGNPRAAQALNGQTNPDNDMSGAIGALLRAGEKINRQLSAFYTTRNPDFIVSNFMRDMLYTNTMAWIKESPNYAWRFHRNYVMVNPVKMKQLLAKYRKNKLSMSDKTEALFHQFMMNGGETGYANIRDIEQHKNDIKRELKKANGKLTIGKAFSLLAEKLDELNRAVENCARFAAFVTSREMGRSIDRAIYDAKEISVNFNKKGSGAKFYDSVGQNIVGNAGALISGLGRSGYVFWNAAIQGTTNFGRQMKRHPAKAFTGVAVMFLLGAIVAYLGGDDDDDDKNAYYNLPEYVRRSNILFRAGDSWISIPLPIEYRAFYGMGELMTSVISGKEHLTDGEIAEAIAGQATQVLPIDFLEGGGGLNAFVPSAAKPLWEAYVAEKSWTGMPLYKDTPYNKNMPEWTKAYKSANKYIVGLAAAMNEATGGDPYTKGGIDFNPSKVEYLLNGYFGGVSGTIDKMTKTAETIVGAREYDPRSILLWNRLVKAGDERTEYRAVNNEYFRLKEEHDRLKTRLKHYEEDTDNGIFDFAEKIDFLYNSPEYERYEIFEEYSKDIDDLYNELKEAIDDEERKDIEVELNEVKKEMIKEMEYTRKR